MDAVRARLLGTVDVWLGEQRLPSFDSARAESVLAYLLLHRAAPQSRQRLAFLLWPDSTERQAQTNLRKVLHTLRHALPDAERLLEIGPRTLQWRPDAALELDVDRFERAVAEGRLEEAVETYGGELLEGRYDDWLLEERDRLAALYLDALERLARRHGENERWPDGVRCAERLVAQDPLREDSHRLLMELCRASGDRAGALRAYHVCATTLLRELGIEPSAETRALYGQLVSAGGDVPGTSPFVGRGRELAGLGAAWSEAASGRARLVLVTGEAGIGKTRLVEELRAMVAAADVEARAYAAEGPVAYGVATSWLRSQPVAARLPRLDRPHLVELARLLPELAAGAPPPEPLADAELRRRLFDAIARALLTAGEPLLLVLDDAHWADAQSLRVVHYLIRSAPTAPVLVAATARREELDEGHPLLRLTTALRALDRLTEIELHRLDREETGELAERITGAPLDAVELERLHGDSEGNPLFVVEALKPDAPEAEAKVQAVIAGRLKRLSPAAADLAGVAAAIGQAFTADVLAAATGLEDQAFVAALDELWRRGIIRAHGPNAYDFSHGRIRDAAYAESSPPRRRQAHLAIACALERMDAAPAELALQYDRAGATADAVRWYERSAETAQWLHAHGDAVRALERALALSEELPAGEDTARLQLRLLSSLPAPLIAFEGYGAERIERRHTRALQLAEQLAIEPEPPLVWSIALAALTRGDWDRAGEFGERLRARADRDDDPILRVESGYIQGITAYWPGRLTEARKHFEFAIEWFEPARRRAHVLRYGQDPELIVRPRLAHTLWVLGHGDDADRQLDLALEAARGSTHAYSRAVLHLWAAILAVDRRDGPELRRHLRELEAHAFDEAPAQVVLGTEMLGGYRDLLDGRSALGLARIREARESVVRSRAPAPGVPGLATRLLLESCAAASESQTGLALADEALVMGRGAELWEAEIRRLRAVFLARLGAPADQVSAELEHALDVARRQEARAFAERIRETLAERSLRHDRAV